MSDSNRRQFLKGLLDTLVQATGSVVLVSATAAAAVAAAVREQTTDATPEKLKERADRLTANSAAATEAVATEFLNFFRNGPGNRNIGWRNGNWGNGPWRNGGWFNGGWPNGGWNNLPWHNGIWSNVPWRNFW